MEFNVSGPVADALALIVPVLRANKDLAGPGLSRAELKNAVLEVQPDFKCTRYGVRTYPRPVLPSAQRGLAGNS